MKLISWNVNGLRACIQKGFLEVFEKLDADFFCLQETKLQEGQLKLELPGYEQYWCYAEKKGYSGTAIFTKHTPLSVSYGIGVEELDNEGRVITLEYPEFYLVNCYTPNAQRGLARLDHRMKWDEAYRAYIAALDAQKPTILCGDLNVAHQEIDLKNPASNRGSAGFSDEERESFTKTLSLGFTDTFRYLHPDVTGAYSWWSYMYHARENNVGWRIDYFLVSDRISQKIYSTPIYSDIFGSDHCPVGLELDLSCNGSVWMEEKKGQPKAILPEKKTAKKTATILLALLAILTITGLGGIAAKLFSPSETEYVTIHPYDHALELKESKYHGLQYYRVQLLDGDITWNLYSTILFVAPPTPVDVENFWLRLELTEEAVSQYSDEWTLDVAADRDLSISNCHKVTDLLYSSSKPQSYDLILNTYYEGDDPTAIRGWFLFGRIPEDTKLHFTLDTGKSKVKFSYDAQPSIDAPSIIEPIQLDTQSLVAKILTDEHIQQELIFSSGTNYSDTIYQNLKASTGELIVLESREDAVIHLLNQLQSQSGNEQLVAHLILSQDIYQRQMNDAQITKFRQLEDDIFALSLVDIVKLSTKELLNYILDYDAITTALENMKLLGSPSDLDALMEKYPALEVFTQRSDMIDVLLSTDGRTATGNTVINKFLYIYEHRMSADENARYLLGIYPAYIWLEDPVHYHFELPLETKTTEELIRMLLLDSGLGRILILANSDEAREAVYSRAVIDSYGFSYIIDKADLIDTLFQMANNDNDSVADLEQDYIKAFLRLSVMQNKMTREQKLLFEEKYRQFYTLGTNPNRHPSIG